MFEMKLWSVLTLIAMLSCISNGATQDGHLVEFHPISQEQYDTILGITDGKPVISEGRLITSGVAALKGLATGLAAGWIPTIIKNFSNSQNSTKLQKQAYPLCVIDANDLEKLNMQQARQNYPTHYDIYGYPPPPPTPLTPTTMVVTGSDGVAVPLDSKPIVNCIVVIRPDYFTTPTPTPSSSTSTTQTTTTTTTTPMPIVRKKKPLFRYSPQRQTVRNSYPYPFPWIPYPSYPYLYPAYEPAQSKQADFYDDSSYDSNMEKPLRRFKDRIGVMTQKFNNHPQYEKSQYFDDAYDYSQHSIAGHENNDYVRKSQRTKHTKSSYPYNYPYPTPIYYMPVPVQPKPKQLNHHLRSRPMLKPIKKIIPDYFDSEEFDNGSDFIQVRKQQ